MYKVRAFNILGNVAIVNFPKGYSVKEKRKFALKILKRNNSIKTVLEKAGKFKGRLRKPLIKFVAGENTKEIVYRENGCIFRFNMDKTYFSSRLSNERKEIASLIKSKDKVFVMFAGVAPFSITIAKNSKASKVYSNELNREANKYGRLNAELNKVKDKIVFLDGDIKRVAKKISGEKFDVIVMPRPQLKDSFLKEAFLLSKKGTKIYYYDFCLDEEKNLVLDKIRNEAVKAKKKINILKMKNAGEIAPYKNRVRVDLIVI
jgi:tRNA (guanine37-N1)-methyltransferase